MCVNYLEFISGVNHLVESNNAKEDGRALDSGRKRVAAGC